MGRAHRKNTRKKHYHQRQDKTRRNKTIGQDPTLDFPFLNHDATVEYIKKSKVMFIMRGLPGSGKSTVVKELQSKYKRGIVCSADDFFLVDGVYHFDADRLSDAHAQCQAKAAKSCENGRHIVIIDNTNIRRWEMGHYLGLAKKHGYVVITVQPKTEWRFNINILATHNKHDVPLDALERKLKMFDKDAPIYWGWFVNEESSNHLRSLAAKYFHLCLEHVSELERHFSLQSGPGGEKPRMNSFYSTDVSDGQILHCTTFFGGRGKALGAETYSQNTYVQKSMGKVFTLWVIGFVITPRTIGVRLVLSDQQLKLWSKDDGEGLEETIDSVPNSPSKRRTGSTSDREQEAGSPWQNPSARDKGRVTNMDEYPRRKKPSDLSIAENKFAKLSMANEAAGAVGGSSPIRASHGSYSQDYSDIPRSNDCSSDTDSDSEEDTICPLTLLQDRPKFAPTSGLGSRAHLTIGKAEGIEAKQTGMDQIELIQCEAQSLGKKAYANVEGAAIRHYGSGRCGVYLDQPLKVQSLFSARY